MPPSFLELLGEIRVEEEYMASRRQVNTAVRPVQTVEIAESSQSAVHSLKAELKDLKAQLTEFASHSRKSSSKESELVTPTHRAAPDSEGISELAALTKQVKQLQQNMSEMKKREPGVSTTVLRVATSANRSPAEKRQQHNISSDYFCYRCGEDGHIASKCRAPENEKKVIQKLITSLRKLKDRGTDKADTTESDRVHCSAKRSAVEVVKPRPIPDGLIGPSSLVHIKINGKPCKALLDSGSQVTIIFEEWHQLHLSNVPIQPVAGLAIWGLSESSYPYKGYVVVDVQFPKELFGVQETISVLAMVCPGPRSPDQTPVILGTNASLFQRLAQLCKETHGVDIASSLGISKTTQAAETPQGFGHQGQDEAVGHVIWTGPDLLHIPSCSRDCVQCNVHTTQPPLKGVLMVEASDSLMLPQGLLLQPMVVPASAIEVTDFKVVIENVSLKEVLIPAGTVVGLLYPANTATPALTMTSSAKIDPDRFQFADSPISEYWKERLKQKLAQRIKAFSLNEWDVGLAKDVEHRIQLDDPRPFRERSRRLAPADIDDVRQHLQDLLAAGIIKESRSPYASPIVVARKKNGSVRTCIDYRTLNSRTVPDQYSTPRVDDALDCLTGSRWFTVLDLRSGYYQITVAEEDKEKTAFICPLGFYQFERTPQGVTGAPATFQRLMEKVVGDMNLLQVLVYLDDLIVFGKTLEEHEERLLKVLDRLEEAGLKVSLDKFQFCQPRVKWLAALATYDFDLEYRPGKTNTDADLLSRCAPGRGNAEQWEGISLPGVKAICSGVSAQYFSEPSFRLAEQLGTPAEAIPTAYAFPASLGESQTGVLSKEDIVTAQKNDMVIEIVKQALKTNIWPSGLLEQTPELGLMKREAEKLVIRDELLYRVKKALSGVEIFQLVLPQIYRQKVLMALHDDMGHLGVERTLEHLRNRFYWPKMAQETEQYVKNCGECVVRKSCNPRAAPLHQITSGGPMDLVCIDFLSLEADSRGFSNILVVTDHFSRYAQAFPTKNQKAITVAKTLVKKYFIHYGLPARIHSDQGRDFESQLIRELLRLLGVRKSRTTPYHPQGDPQPERFNHTLLSMLGTLPSTQKRQWSQYVARLVHAYNSTKNDATGYSPYFLMYGREARLPVDISFGNSLKGDEEVTHSQYVRKLRQDLESAYRLAAEAADKNHQRNKKLYDKLVRCQALDHGDRVLLKNLGLKGKHKLQARWNPVPYVVIGKMPNLPVYQVKPEEGMRSVKTIHRDHLLPIGQLVRLPHAVDDELLQNETCGQKTCEPVPPRTATKQAKQNPEMVYAPSDSESDEDCEVHYTLDTDGLFTQNDVNTGPEVSHDSDAQGSDFTNRELNGSRK
ncbi:hypothetical protein MHYP_G00186060 [Metynnis hypsauchen]